MLKQITEFEKEFVMRGLGQMRGIEFDGDDNRVFLSDGFSIDVYANDMTKEEYASMEKEINRSEIAGPGFEVYAWNDVSGYNFWKAEGENHSGNYIQIAAVITDVSLVCPEMLLKAMLELYDRLRKYHNLDGHDFSTL